MDVMDPIQPTSNIPVQPIQEQFIPSPSKPVNKLLFVIGGLIILFIGLFGGYYLIKSSSKPPVKGCTLEAKICPDGSSVSRTGPNCEFGPCLQITTTPTPTPILINESSQNATANWKTYSNEQSGYSLKYPDTWIFLARSEGCGPVFSPPDTKQIWLTVCGLYINPTDTPQNLANGSATSAYKISEAPITIDNHQGIKQELTRNDQQEINTFIGNISGLITYAGGEIRKEKGTLGIYYYINDLTKIDSARHDFDQILSTFRFD